MGGPGSGRTIGTETRVNNLLGFNQPADTDNAAIYLPNLSGIKDSVRKDFVTGWTSGSVVFVGATGDFAQDNANLFWDNTNNRLGIGTSSPGYPLEVLGTTDVPVVFRNANGQTRFHMDSTKNFIYSVNPTNTAYRSFAIQTGATPGLFVEATTGDVGIGTTDPRVRTHVITSSVGSTPPAAGTYYGAAIFGADQVTYGLYIGAITTGKGYIQAQRGDTATTYDLLIQPNGGNVGIGTTSPDSLLNLQQSTGTAADMLHIRDNVDTVDLILLYDGSSAFQLRSEATGGGKNYLTFQDSTGNVGIGTTAPSKKLEVWGDATYSASFLSGGVTIGRAVNPFLMLNYGGTDVGQFRALTSGSMGFTNAAAAATPVFVFNTTSGNIGMNTTTPDSTLHISGGSIVYSKTTAPTLVTGSGAIFISGGAGAGVELWLKGPTTQTRLGSVT